MRISRLVGLTLAAAILFLGGCGSGGSGGTVVQAPSALNYTTSTAIYTKGAPIAANIPTSSGGEVASYSVSPALPAGLSQSTSTGVISGTPTAVTPTAIFTVMATNAGGSTFGQPEYHRE